MNEQKIYVGQAHVKSTQYGDITNVWLTPEGMKAINQYMADKGKDSVNLSIVEKKPESQKHRATHYVAIDTWEPEHAGNAGGAGGAGASSTDPGDFPF